MKDLDVFIGQVMAYEGELSARANAFCKDTYDAEDLFQDTVEKAIKYRDKFEPGTNLRAWLHTILKNTFINKWRKFQKSPERVLVENSDLYGGYLENHELGATQIADEKGIIEVIEAIQVLDLLATHMTPDFFVPLYLAEVVDLSYQGVADKLGIPMGTVMSRLYRGRRKAKEILERHYRDRLKDYRDIDQAIKQENSQHEDIDG